MPTDFNPTFLLDPNDPKGLAQFLQQHDYLAEGERLERLETAGEGNMNVVLRAITNHRSFILKQSRPWVNKFPSIPAPADRIHTEHDFYRTVQQNEVIRAYTPVVNCYDAENFIICLEDFGPANDFTSIYRKGVNLKKKEMADMARVVSELHFAFKDQAAEEAVVNMEMRLLDHQHIFVLPLLQGNGFDLDAVMPGLQAGSERLRTSTTLNGFADELGRLYLSEGGSRLLHGDYYPGSWLNTANGFKMIDPEFCFTGPAEFELGVAVAHLKMAQQPDSLVKDLFVYYHFDGRFDGSLFSKFAGMEIIRRLIGLAQLPLELDLKERLDLLDEAYELVLNG